MAVPRSVFYPSVALLATSIALSITTLIESAWASVASGNRHLAFGLVGYTDSGSSGSQWVAYTDAGDNAKDLLSATSVQFCLVLFGMCLNAVAVWWLLQLLHCFRRRNMHSSAAHLRPVSTKCCCCGCGRAMRARRTGPMARYAPAACFLAALTFIASAITWPLVGVKASQSFASSKGMDSAEAILGYCYTLSILSSVCSLVGGVLAFLVLQFGEVKSLSKRTGVAVDEETGNGKFNVEAALASLEGHDEEEEFARRRASSRNSREAAAAATAGAQGHSPRGLGHWIKKMTRAITAQPKSVAYGKVNTEMEMSPRDSRSRPADLINPFASHVDDHRVESYMISSIDEAEQERGASLGGDPLVAALRDRIRGREDTGDESI